MVLRREEWTCWWESSGTPECRGCTAGSYRWRSQRESVMSGSFMKGSVGILAFGSLIDEPGPEIEEATTSRITGIFTPFGVEFARSSVTRAGAPTLVPLPSGGLVPAELLVLKVPEQEAKDRLWRREIRRIGQGGHYRHSERPGPNTLIIDTYPNFGGVAIALAARFPANIAPLTAHELARLAIASARHLDNGLDGITYLMNTKRKGIVTPLSPEYEAEILHRTGTEALQAALAQIRGSRAR